MTKKSDMVDEIPLNNESRREVSACNCLAGGVPEAVDSSSAVVAAEEARTAVELTARQRRIMGGS